MITIKVKNVLQIYDNMTIYLLIIKLFWRLFCVFDISDSFRNR